jgi:hypothetical protein
MAKQLKHAGARSASAVARGIERFGDSVSQLLLVSAVLLAVVSGVLSL